MKVPAGSSSRRRLRLKGRGLPNQARQAGELLRRGADHGAQRPSPTTSSGCSRSSRGLHLRPEEQTMTAVTHFALARPYRLSLDSYALVDRRASRPGPPPGRPRAARSHPRRAGAPVVRPLPGEGDGPDPAAARWPRPQLRRPRPGRRPARPDRRAGEDATANRHDEEALHGHEQTDPEVAGGAARRPDQGAALRPHRGRRRAPAARPARPARGLGRRRCSPRPAPTRTGCATTLEAELGRRPRVSGPGADARAGARHPAARRGCSTRPSARPSGSRTSTSRSSTS